MTPDKVSVKSTSKFPLQFSIMLVGFNVLFLFILGIWLKTNSPFLLLSIIAWVQSSSSKSTKFQFSLYSLLSILSPKYKLLNINGPSPTFQLSSVDTIISSSLFCMLAIILGSPIPLSLSFKLYFPNNFNGDGLYIPFPNSIAIILSPLVNKSVTSYLS